MPELEFEFDEIAKHQFIDLQRWEKELALQIRLEYQRRLHDLTLEHHHRIVTIMNSFNKRQEKPKLIKTPWGVLFG